MTTPNIEELRKLAESAIAATEPYCFHWVDRWGCNHYADPKESIGPNAQPLFTHPMPAQDVTELVEALEGLMHKDCGEPAFVKARTALSKYKGAK